VLLLLVLSLSAGRRKFAEEGLASPRLGYVLAGLHYLTEGQVLGTGLGSCESILDPVSPKPDPTAINTVLRLHNDYAQILLELGYPGFALLVWFLLVVGREFAGTYRQATPETRLQLLAVAVGVFILALHSVWEFPLRMNAIRLFMLVLVFHCIQAAKGQPRTNGAGRLLPALCLSLCIAATAYFAIALRTPILPEGAHLEDVQRAYRDGREYDAPFFAATETVARCFEPGANRPTPLDLHNAYALLCEHLQGQPFNLKSLTMLLIIEVELFKLEHTGISRAEFDAFVVKARAIRALGRDANFHSRSALTYVFAQFKGLLTLEQQAEYRALTEPIERELRIQRNDMIRQRKRDAGKPD